MVSIGSVDFTPYKTFYEKYLQYPIFEPRERSDKDGPRLIPNNLQPITLNLIMELSK